MATRIGESKALANRCARAGWRVEDTQNGWKVYDDNKRPHVIHRTYSDGQWSLKLITKELEEAGLTEAEAAIKLQRAEARKAAARAAKEEEARSLAAAEKRAANHNTMVVKAAGPYMVEPEDVDYSWFAEPHPAPWMRIVWINPQLAKKILDNHNTDNRPTNESRIEHYRNIILSDQWKLTHQGGAQDTRGVVQDCQHRLYAIVEAGKVAPDVRVPMVWWVGMPVENFAAIDEGLLRTAAHLFSKGGEKNAATLQAMCRLVIAYKADDGNVRRAYRQRVTNAEVLHAFDKDPELLRESAKIAASSYRRIHCSATPLATAMYLIRSANRPGNTYVDAFFAGIITGRKTGTRLVLDDDDPRQVLREELMRIASSPKNRRPPVDIVALFILSWNNLVLERFPKTIRFSEDAQPPQVLICDDTTGRNPRALDGELEAHVAA